MNVDDWEAKGNTHIDLDLEATMPYHEVVAKLIAKHCPPNGRVVDLGCGLGHIEKELLSSRSDIKVDVADAYEACLETTGRLANIGERTLIDELLFNVELVPSRDYDVVVMSHVLEHLMFPSKAINDALNLLNKNGVLVVAVPNPVRPSVFATNLLKSHYVNRGHIHAWDGSHWRNFLEQIMQLDVLEYETDYIQLPACSRSKFSRSLGKFLVKFANWWGFSNIAVARRRPGTKSMYERWNDAMKHETMVEG